MTAAPPAPAQLQVTHASGLHAVNRMLAGLHRDMLRGGSADGGVVRLSVVNLVVACVDETSADMATQAIDHIGAKHPARAIVVVADPDGEASIEADLSLRCLREGDGQICIEQVQLQVCGPAAFHLASVVTPLLVPDIPVFLWLAGAPPVRQAFGQDAIAICERLIIDSGAYVDVAATLHTLAGEMRSVGDSVSLCDVAWERFRPWRQLIANAFDGVEMRGFLHAIDGVEVSCAGTAVSAQTWLLGGWLSSRLRWGDDGPRVAVELQPGGGAGESDLTGVVVHCVVDGSRATVEIRRTGDLLHAAIDVDGGIHAERTVRQPQMETVDLVAQLLEQIGEDPVYRAALSSGAQLARAHDR